ncbi:choice-of-anchor Q domain-containing protein [Rudaea cellulosilytica]|uniref:choice-of-anchor Q domain-containing protein n=1 Tax=Rudaea cellulosilytica TaxID=540746 RepID=UPI000366C1A2|nr:choice-of-anchor Q domain-containing protein [Rudaea cellulosilytica]
MLRFILLLTLAFGFYETAAAEVVRIADGDCGGLGKAVTAASNSGTNVTILLARGGRYPVCEIDATSGSIDIDAQGSTFQFLCAGIGAHATVMLRNAIITTAGDNPVPAHCGAVVDGFGGSFIAMPAIQNAGSLTLERVAIRGVERPVNLDVGAYGGYAGFIMSYGALVIRNATIADNNDASLITSAGKAEIYNSTFSNNVRGGLNFVAYSSSIDPGVLISNSVLARSDGAACGNGNVAVTSLGGNVATDTSCGLSADAGDKIVGGLVLPAASDHGGLVPTVQIGYGNPAYRTAIAKYCEATDARGVTRNAMSCDAGAYESGGGLGLVTANGMNGLYYVPGISNGHYVSVQRIHDNKDVMVFWNTFDQNGNQAWLFGVGTLTSDRHVHALMYSNLGGVLQPGGAPTGAKPSEWGTVDIDVTSCSAAQFAYQSSLPEFGSGQFPLTRLAFESAINCGD